MAVTCPLTVQLLAAVHRATGPPPDAAALTADECAGALPGPVVEAADAPGRALAGRTCSRMRSASRRETSSATAGGRSSSSTRWDGTLLRAWETTIDPAGTIHLRGDVALARALDPARLARLGARPARKVLVLGNHDFGPTGTPTETGSDETSITLVVPRRAHPPRDARPALACAGRSRQSPQPRAAARWEPYQHLRRADRLPPAAPLRRFGGTGRPLAREVTTRARRDAGRAAASRGKARRP